MDVSTCDERLAAVVPKKIHMGINSNSDTIQAPVSTRLFLISNVFQQGLRCRWITGVAHEPNDGKL